MKRFPALPVSGFLPEEIRREFPVASRLLRLRLAATADLPLSALRSGALPLKSLAPDLAAALPSAGTWLAGELSGSGVERLAGFVSRDFSRYLMRKNQYLPFQVGWDKAAKDCYVTFFREFAACGGDVRQATAALSIHQQRLRALLAAREAGGNFDDEPICASYSPSLQLRVLRLSPDRLLGPILDLGCGQNGALVRHLQAFGRTDVFGLDALCETGGSFVRGSWFEVPLRANSLGTIIAHQSFSLHVLRAHHQGSRSNAVTHVRTFMRVLEALRPGGVFCYAPSIPFLEDLLPSERWSVRRWQIGVGTLTSNFEATQIRALPCHQHSKW